jgi:pyruvate,water dikinase
VSWSNANVNENFPDPISPFLYSIASLGYYHYFRNLGLAFGVSRRRLTLMEPSLRAIIGVHGARMYYNLSSIHAVLRMAPFGEALAGAFNRFVGTDGSAPPPRGAVGWASRRGRLSQALEVARIVVCTAWQYLFFRRRIEMFERTADEFVARTRPEMLAGRSLSELGDDLQAFLTIRFQRWKNASLADTAAMVSYAWLEHSLRGLGEGVSLHNRLLRALPGVPSSQPPVRLWALSRLIRADEGLRELFASRPASAILDAVRSDLRFSAFLEAFDRFLDEWGFRSSAELMLTVPSLQERPEPAIDLLKQYAACDGEPPEAAMARQAVERVADTTRVYRTLRFRSPLRAIWIRVVLRWTQLAVCYRERARLKQALLYTRCRRVAMAIGDLLARSGAIATRDDVFMLTWQEVEELVTGRAMFPYSVARLVELRQGEHERLSAMRPPDAMPLGEGEYLPQSTVRQPAGAPPSGADTSSEMRGTSACGGTTTARAAVLADVSESQRLGRGDILVTRQTDPGWGPVFCLISGLVIERGGMLSHGAILAREFGLPCIVGVKDATRRIPHGAIVTVDGDRGTCVIAAPAPAEPEAGEPQPAELAAEVRT